MTGRMLCSGTGGPAATFDVADGKPLYPRCPVCRRGWDRPGLLYVPRHFIQTTQAA